MFQNLFDKFMDWRVRKVMERGLPDAWIETRRIWSSADAVYRGPVGFGAERPFEFRLLMTLITEFPDSSEKLFQEGLASDDTMIKAYCIVGLELIGSHFSCEVQNSLRNCSDIIRWRLGCYSSKSTLGEFYEMHKCHHHR